MNKIAVVTAKLEQWKQVKKGCRDENFLFYWISPEEATGKLEEGKVQLVVLDIEDITTLAKLMRGHDATRDIPVLWVLPRQKMEAFKPEHKVSDLIFAPFDHEELFCRIRRLLWQNQNADSHPIIHGEGLSIDLVKYEVRLEGELVNLTYKEYELLKFLASNKGKVFTREVLLNKVWGYDYFGGTRTVDVHIRRLRSKIEDARHTYIDTVRHIGYRFKE